MLEKYNEVIKIYKRLLRKGVTRIAYGECGEGISSARSTVNDSRYRLGLIYAAKGEFILAKKYLKQYIAYRNNGFSSIYDLREAKKDLKAILQDELVPQNWTGC
jgi:hypothetical protein